MQGKWGEVQRLEMASGRKDAPQDRLDDPERGSLLLIVIMMVLVGSVAVASVAKVTSTSSKVTNYGTYSTQAVYLAEAGMDAAMYVLAKGGCNTGSQSYTSPVIGTQGQYSYQIVFSSTKQNWTISSTGYAPSQSSPKGARTISQVVPTCFTVPNPVQAGSGLLTVGNNAGGDWYDQWGHHWQWGGQDQSGGWSHYGNWGGDGWGDGHGNGWGNGWSGWGHGWN